MTISHLEVVENWVEQTGVCQRGHNMFYEGDTIYSYGHHYPAAKIFPKCTLINSYGYSVSTQKHLSLIRRSMPGIIIPVPDPTNKDIARNLEYLKGEIQNNKDRLLRIRSNIRLHYSRYMNSDNNLAYYMEIFNVE